MSIRFKTLAIIAISLLVSVIVNFVILDRSVWPSFVSLERKETKQDMARVKELIVAEIDDVSAGLWDYSSWDDTYDFAQNRNPQFPDIYLHTDPLVNMRMDVIELYDVDNQRIFDVVFDRSEGRRLHEQWSLADLDPQKQLFAHPDEESSISGIIKTPRGPLLIASRPIVKTSGAGPVAGTFFFGRFLDSRLVTALREKIKVDFHVINLDDVTGAEDRDALQRLRDQDKELVIDETSDEYLTAYALLGDYSDRPILLLKATIARNITAIGRRSLWASVGGVVLAGAVIMAVTGILLQWLLVAPLINLTKYVVEIGSSGALSRRLKSPRRDEIGILSGEFDKMLANLEDARDRLLESSYRSGIAEMASGVIHNLRNQLAPLNMRVDRIRETLVPTSDGKVDLALKELNAATTPPDRKEKYAQYIALRFSDSARAQSRTLEELANVAEDLRCVESVLRELDRFSHARIELEDVALITLIDRTIARIPTFPNVRITYEVDPTLQFQPAVRSVSFVLGHVLNNLFMNAIESIVAAGRHEGRIAVAGRTIQLDGQVFVDLEIRDNGAGIHPENLEKIFSRGFSTKHKHSGTGLHWSANRLAALQGKIRAESAGGDQGATMHVFLPVVETAGRAVA